jgi:ABC-type proline/glycine betaine transport system substrate-binding protein
MLVQLFLEEDLKQINLKLLLFKNFNLEEGQLADLMTIIKDKGEEAEQEWYEANKVLVDSWMK